MGFCLLLANDHFEYIPYPKPFPLSYGKLPLRALFQETHYTTASDLRPPFTLKLRDYELPSDSILYIPEGPNLLRSIYQAYLTYSDPSEYSFAMGVLGEWEHWRQLREATFFQETYGYMKDALRVKIKSEAVEAAKKALKEGVGPGKLQAAKWLHDSVNDRPKAKRGRPSNDEIVGELKRQAEETRDFEEDRKRLGI